MKILLFVLIKIIVSLVMVAFGFALLIAGAIFITHVLGYQYGWDQTVRDILALLIGAIVFSFVGAFVKELWRGQNA